MQHNAAFSLTRMYGPAVTVKGSLRRASPALDRAHRTLLSSANPLEFQKRHKYAMAGDGDQWLGEALLALDQQYEELQIKDEDFDDLPDREWEPLPIDRNDPDLKAVIEKIDDTHEQVRADNGYAAHLPEERAYIMDSLGMLAKKLKEASAISRPYIRRYAIEPLSLLIRRFGQAAIGLLATAAKEAFKEWLKKRGVFFLDGL